MKELRGEGNTAEIQKNAIKSKESLRPIIEKNNNPTTTTIITTTATTSNTNTNYNRLEFSKSTNNCTKISDTNSNSIKESSLNDGTSRLTKQSSIPSVDGTGDSSEFDGK